MEPTTKTSTGAAQWADVAAQYSQEREHNANMACSYQAELTAMTKDRDHWRTTSASWQDSFVEQCGEAATLAIELEDEREKVAKLRKVANHSPNCAKSLGKPCDCGLDQALEETK